jgi:hypothetical protein
MTDDNTPMEQVAEVTTETTTEVKNESLSDALKAAFDKAKAEKPVEEVEKPAEEPKEEPAEEVEEKDEIEEITEKEFPLIPKDWSAEEKESFEALLASDDPEKRMAAEILIERYNLLKKGFYNKTMEYSQKTREVKELDNVFKPYEQQMIQAGTSKTQYIQNMIQWEQMLHKDPVNGVLKVMEVFGVRPEQITPRDEFTFEEKDFTMNENYANNEMTQVKTELQNLKAYIANQPIQAQIQAFETATTPEGKLMHPRFKEVAPLMGTLIQQSGNTLPLDKAYQKAIRVLDDQDETPSSPAVDIEKLRQKVAQAKKASKSVTTKGGRPDFSKMTLQQELAARLTKQQ